MAAANVADATAPAPDEATAPAANGATVGGKADRTHKGDAAPTATFDGPDGKKMTLASFAGKPFVLNLWATWCVPCRVEMPALDTIASEGKLAVVPVGQDLDGAKIVQPFFAQMRFKALKPYTDAANAMAQALGNPSLPTTILYDKHGHEVWRVTGGMDWTGTAARDLLAEAK